MKVMKWSPWQVTQWSHVLARGGDGQLQCNCRPCSAIYPIISYNHCDYYKYKKKQLEG